MVFGLQMQETEYTECGVADSRQNSVLNCRLAMGIGGGGIDGQVVE